MNNGLTASGLIAVLVVLLVFGNIFSIAEAVNVWNYIAGFGWSGVAAGIACYVAYLLIERKRAVAFQVTSKSAAVDKRVAAREAQQKRYDAEATARAKAAKVVKRAPKKPKPKPRGGGSMPLMGGGGGGSYKPAGFKKAPGGGGGG